MSMAFLFFYARWIHYLLDVKQIIETTIFHRISELSKRLLGNVWREQSERKLIEKLLFELVNIFLYGLLWRYKHIVVPWLIRTQFY